MPTNKREDFYFGFMMVCGMVVVMTFYNLVRSDLIGTISWDEILIQLFLGFIVAFLLELFIVGPVVKKVAFSLPYDKSKKGLVIVSISFCMVVGMVTCMSLYGLGMTYFSDGLNGESLLSSYFSIFINNFIFAFPLQLMVMGPLVRYLFGKFVKGRRFTLVQ
ncbi:hypothetical protein [Cohnella cholangitidis]|uniref:DUF2798 domain-containing protein n=1 Tax=Cohnella cholangitidis TaxID=2598458 RepID=A0A7G5BS62_9BACL|nr:hypothetical protein [Cohnella cholangitidis]QMV39796.1 hypothetical protein FPL14_00185 [Cohnella cholangitidis]